VSKTTALAAVLGAVALSWVACTQAPTPFSTHQKMVILGFDGMDPTLLQQYLDAGLMPNFKRVMGPGGFWKFGTTASPESPTAWASFATGVNPGKHNIYDFLIRDTSTYLPDLGMVHTEPPKFLFNLIPISKPKVTSLRGGTSFWVTAGQAGVRSDVLTVPITFPPEQVPNGDLLSGLPTPDIRGTIGTFYYFATDLSRYEEGNTEFGGILKHLTFEGDTAHTLLDGPPNPIVKTEIKKIYNTDTKLTDADRTKVAELEAKEDVMLPMTITWQRGSGSAVIDIDGQQVALKAGQWSNWVNLSFEINVFVRLQGMVQLYLINANDELQLYISPVNFRPNAPPVPISSPASFSTELYQQLGTYRTLGWAEATWGLNENRLAEGPFMDDLYRAFDDRARVILNRLDQKNWDLLVGVIESTDRVQHMMFRLIDPTNPMYDAGLAAKYGDSIQKVYQRADQFVGQVLDRMPRDATLLIVSDHGFHSWRKAVNLNTWLVQNGYMVLNAPESGEGQKTLGDLFGGGEFWENVDWSKTRAYAMGIGQIYFNLRGREAKGIVSPGQQYTQLADELSKQLLASLVDPETGEHIVHAVYKRDDVFHGPYINNAPDLQVGFADGYRVSWQTSLGGSPPGLVYPNNQKWTGDHCGFDYKQTSGILVANRPIDSSDPQIIDIAPTVLRFFGVKVPADIDGHNLLGPATTAAR
jgi:predicted AlkP superfamily phosphohydrolase/phosphomutase